MDKHTDMTSLPRFLTVTRVARTWELTWVQAESIVREQTRQLAAWKQVLVGGHCLLGCVMAFLLPDHPREWPTLGGQLLGALLIVQGLILPRILARSAIIASADKMRKSGADDGGTRHLAQAMAEARART